MDLKSFNWWLLCCFFRTQ